jgi:hypothetical protein
MDVKSCCEIIERINKVKGRVNAAFSERCPTERPGPEYSSYDAVVFFGGVGSSCAATISVRGDVLEAVSEALGPRAVLIESDEELNRYTLILEDLNEG